MIIRFFDIWGIWGIAIWIFTHNIREGNSYNYKRFASDGIWTQDLLKGALNNDYTELKLHFCLNNNYTFSQIFRVLNNNYTNLNRVE